jgi:hypothetical protein
MRTAIALIALAAAACSKESKPAETKAAATPPVLNAIKIDNPQVDSADGATKHLGGDHFTIDLASAGCKAGAECTMTIKLAIDGDFHLNKEYPYRFIAKEAAGVDYLGKKDKTKFTKEDGDFVADGEKAGTMTVRFKPAATGKTKITGTYKMSLCSADQCQIEEPALELTIPAS